MFTRRLTREACRRPAPAIVSLVLLALSSVVGRARCRFIVLSTADIDMDTGGISFVSEHHGWACDTVIEFEVVLANSSIVRVSEDAHPFLYWALKGGGNNFGIVTSVTLEIYHGPPTWYSFQRFAANDVDLVFDRLERHTAAMSKDVCQIAVTLEWHVASVQFVISERVVAYQVPELPEALIRTCGNGTAEESAVLQTDSYQRSILAMAQKMDAMNKYGYYNFFGSVTVKNDAYVSLLLASTFMEHVAYIRGAEGLQVYIVYNPLTCNTLRHMQKRGGNALGLSPEDGPLTSKSTQDQGMMEADADCSRQYQPPLEFRT